MNLRSWSVILALTRMWRTMVAIMRGGNVGGEAWQREQLARKRFSPSSRMAPSSWELWVAAAAGAGVSLLLSSGFAPADSAGNTAIRRNRAGTANRAFTSHLHRATPP